MTNPKPKPKREWEKFIPIEDRIRLKYLIREIKRLDEEIKELKAKLNQTEE